MHAVAPVGLLALAMGACSSQSAGSSVPQRSCGLTVWYKPTSPASVVQVVGSWDGWSQPGTTMGAAQDGWRAARFDQLAPGPAEYVIVDDGDTLLDPNVGTTAFHQGREVTWVQIPDCSAPAVQIDAVNAGASGAASIDASFLASEFGTALDPSRTTLTSVHGATPTSVKPSGDPSTGKIHVDLAGLPPGKATLSMTACDTAGRLSPPTTVTVWTEPHPWDWRDAVVYEVMVDRYRARDGSALAAPASMGGRAGGQIAGVTHAVESGELQALGVNTLWLTPLYANPDGQWQGLDGREYTSYHGYWPTQSRTLESAMTSEGDLEALVAAAHARGMRVLYDVVPHHVHTQHPYWQQHAHDGWFQQVNGQCICGVDACSWAEDETSCWFTAYLPSLDWTDDTVASTVTSDVLWWLDRFDGDGVRIDAVPMMPRAAIRRIAWAARAEYDNPSFWCSSPNSCEHADSGRTLMLGENYTGQTDWASLKYFLGPTGLDSEFHFPLMWALRSALAQDYQTMVDVDATIRTGEQTWSGSGAVMGLILDNHDTSRFVTLAAGQDDGQTWTPAPQPTDPAVYGRTQMALAMLYTLPGAPVLYYGDEVALAGKSDPDSRRVMPGESALGALQRATRDLVRTLGKARACSDALRRGTYRMLHVDAEHLVYAREETAGGQVAVVDVQRATTAPLSASLPGIPAGSWVDVLSGRTLSLSPELTTLASDPFSVSLYVPAHSPCAP